MNTNRIENITDQINGFSEEIVSVVKSIMERYDLTWEQAIQAVKVGSSNILAETLHHELHDMAEEIDRISTALTYIGNVLEYK